MALGGVVSILVAIALIGLIAWAIVYFVPMPPKFAVGIYVVAGIAALLIVLGMVSGGSTGIRVGHLDGNLVSMYRLT